MRVVSQNPLPVVSPLQVDNTQTANPFIIKIAEDLINYYACIELYSQADVCEVAEC